MITHQNWLVNLDVALYHARPEYWALAQFCTSILAPSETLFQQRLKLLNAEISLWN